MKKYLIFILMFVLVFGFAAVSLAEEGFSENGNWYYNIEEDPMTDKIELMFNLVDEDNMGSDFKSYEADTLIIRKLPEYETEIFISWSDYLADNNQVSWRFDKGNVHTDRWSVSEGGEALFFPRDRNIIDFVKKLLKSEEIAIQVKPYEQTKEASVFQTAGLGEVILPYLEELGWEELESVIEEK